jgi:uncharacterized protein DUF4390
MPRCARNSTVTGGRWRRVFSTVVLGAVVSCTPASASSFKVSSIEARAANKTLSLRGTIELGLTPAVEEAIGTGIPIQLAIDVRLYRVRPFLWDQTAGSWKLHRELRYYALTGQYLINAEAGAPVTRESFASLNEALIQMGLLEDLTLALKQQLRPESDYRLEFRAALDVEALPPLLRPVAYTSRAWDLDSGWTAWRVER